MSMIWSIVWGILTAAVMLITMKYYMPRLLKRVQVGHSDSSLDSEQTEEIVPKDLLGKHRIGAIILLILCGCFAGWCGYVAGGHGIPLVNTWKMTITSLVLACIFITDYEIFMIPNLCPAILGIAGIIFTILDFVINGESAIAGFLSNLIALIISLIVLLIMSKVTKGGLGMGDVKLFSTLGFLCGIYALLYTLLFSFVSCALVSTVLLIIKKKHLKDALPMGPFIWLGFHVAVLLTLI